MFGPIRIPAMMYPMMMGILTREAIAAPRKPTVAMTPTSNMIDVVSIRGIRLLDRPTGQRDR
jgi:hypothetical protein